MTLKPILFAVWLLLASAFAAMLFFVGPPADGGPQLFGFIVGMSFWGAWRLGEWMSRR